MPLSDAPRLAPPSADGSPLPLLLSLVAGSADVISFLGLGGLFTAHITGNLVILAARLAAGEPAPPAVLLSVPAFMLVLVLARLLAAALAARDLAPLRPLLALQFALLAGCLALSAGAEPNSDAAAPAIFAAGMLGVAAMAVQNALVQIALTGAPSTAAMTTNVTRFAMDLGDLLTSAPAERAAIRRRLRHTWPAIAGFGAGCALGAAAWSRIGLGAFALPVALALLAVALPARVAARRAS